MKQLKISLQIGTASRLIGSNGRVAEEGGALCFIDQRCVCLISLCQLQKQQAPAVGGCSSCALWEARKILVPDLSPLDCQVLSKLYHWRFTQSNIAVQAR